METIVINGIEYEKVEVDTPTCNGCFLMDSENCRLNYCIDFAPTVQNYIIKPVEL
jgi:hypothetical protein